MIISLKSTNAKEWASLHSIVETYGSCFNDKDIEMPNDTLSITTKDNGIDHSKVLMAVKSELDNAMLKRNIVSVIDRYTDVSEIFPFDINMIKGEYKLHHNYTAYCEAMSKLIAHDAYMGCSDLLTRIKRASTSLNKLNSSDSCYDPDFMAYNTFVNVMIDVMFTFSPVDDMKKIASIINDNFKHCKKYIHRIPKDKYDFIISNKIALHDILLVVDEEYEQFPKTQFIFTYKQFSYLMSKVKLSDNSKLYDYRDPQIIKSMIKAYSDANTRQIEYFGMQIDERHIVKIERIMKRCGSLTKEPV